MARISLWFDPQEAKEIEAEAKRLDRSISWIAQQAWRRAREKMLTAPSAPSLEPVSRSADHVDIEISALEITQDPSSVFMRSIKAANDLGLRMREVIGVESFDTPSKTKIVRLAHSRAKP